MCFEPCSKPTDTCCLCCLEERPEVLLKADSITDFKNMLQGTYKDTRLTLTETVLLSFLSPTLNMVLFAEALLEATTQGIYEKMTLVIPSGFFRLKYGTVLPFVKLAVPKSRTLAVLKKIARNNNIGTKKSCWWRTTRDSLSKGIFPFLCVLSYLKFLMRSNSQCFWSTILKNVSVKKVMLLLQKVKTWMKRTKHMYQLGMGKGTVS